jgi:hypothetical protein
MKKTITFSACLFIASAMFSQASGNEAADKKISGTVVNVPLPSQTAAASPEIQRKVSGPVLLPSASQIIKVTDPAALKKTAVKVETEGKKD